MKITNKKMYAVLGLSKFGYRLAVSLYKAGATVIAIDKNESLVQQISSEVTTARVADLLNWEVLEQVGVLKVDTVIIGTRHAFDVATLLTYKLKKQGNIKNLIVQVDSDEKAETLKLIGADIVVFPEKDIADKLYKQLTSPNLVDHISLTSDAGIIEVPAPKNFIGKSLVELKIRNEYDVYVVGVKHKADNKESSDITIAPSPNEIFKEGDTLLLLGKIEKLEKFMEKKLNGKKN